MVDERRGVRITGDITPTTVAWFLVGGGIILLGWKLLGTLSGNAKAAQALTDSMIEEAQTMQLYIAGGNYTDADTYVTSLLNAENLYGTLTTDEIESAFFDVYGIDYDGEWIWFSVCGLFW